MENQKDLIITSTGPFKKVTMSDSSQGVIKSPYDKKMMRGYREFRAEVNKTNVKPCRVKGVKSRRLRFQGQITDEEKELANQKNNDEEDDEDVNGENDDEDDEEEEEEDEIEDEDSNRDDGGEEEDQEENEREAEDLDEEEEDKIEVEDVREDEEIRFEKEEDERKVPKRPERREGDGVNDETMKILAEVMTSGKRTQELYINCPE